MRTAWHMSTVVKAGHKVEVTAHELNEGVSVEVFLVVRGAGGPTGGEKEFRLRNFFAAAEKGLIDSDAVESLRRQSRL